MAKVKLKMAGAGLLFAWNQEITDSDEKNCSVLSTRDMQNTKFFYLFFVLWESQDLVERGRLLSRNE